MMKLGQRSYSRLMASTQLASPEYETSPTKSFVGLEVDSVNMITSSEDETWPTESFAGHEAGVNNFDTRLKSLKKNDE
ncbi:hypothetical protein Taro_022861 [Colocasia esculenta]|uniref:Uncharacterized protein n=1 Tax=Colocasia esculenta TaxID=4460 RepID=A0A843VCQ1_COLES|nr:hypothetical protein [Colocasia esculenta]